MTKPPIWLNVKDAADYLRLKPRKLYDLVANRQINHTRAGAKLLFSPEGLDAYLRANTVTKGANTSNAPLRTAIISGSHDPLLEWAIRQSGAEIGIMCRGSRDGLEQMKDGAANAALLHLPSNNLQSFNLHAVAEAARGQAWVLLHFATREQGFIAKTQTGAIRHISQLYARQKEKKAVRLGRRQSGAGSRELLDLLIEQYEAAHPAQERKRAFVWVDEFKSEYELAQAIHTGEIDLGLGIRAGATPLGLHFEPQLLESLDLLIDRHAFFEPGYQTLFEFMAGSKLRVHANALGGYNLEQQGRVRWNG